jgi:hypothetical protein
LRTYRYKRGWTFELVQRGQGARDLHFLAPDPYWIRIHLRVPDSRWTPLPGKTEEDRPLIAVTSDQAVWEPLWLAGPTRGASVDQQHNAEMFTAMLREMIRNVEDHETDEWFRRGDQLVHDPHAQKVPSKIGPIHNA